MPERSMGTPWSWPPQERPLMRCAGTTLPCWIAYGYAAWRTSNDGDPESRPRDPDTATRQWSGRGFSSQLYRPQRYANLSGHAGFGCSEARCVCRRHA